MIIYGTENQGKYTIIIVIIMFISFIIGAIGISNNEGFEVLGIMSAENWEFWTYLIVAIITTEILFIIFSKMDNGPYDIGDTIAVKVVATGIAFIGSLGIFAIKHTTQIIETILPALVVIAGIVVWVGINHFIAKEINKPKRKREGEK